jgi:hypothetical protein
MVTTMSVAVLWDVMLCSLVDVYNCYTGMCWFSHHGSTGTQTHTLDIPENVCLLQCALCWTNVVELIRHISCGFKWTEDT